jgi:hypothetical protein
MAVGRPIARTPSGLGGASWSNAHMVAALRVARALGVHTGIGARCTPRQGRCSQTLGTLRRC